MRIASLERVAGVSLLASVALLPFPGLLPPPWPESAARWSDLPLALALIAFALSRARGGFRPAPWQVAALAYAGWVVLSWLVHGADRAGGQKALGIASLAGTAILVAELRVAAPLARIVCLGAIASAGLSLTGLVAHALGFVTPLVGWTGDLIPGTWARAQAGFSHPNLAASYALFAWGAAAAEGDPRLRRMAQAAAAIVAVAGFSRAVLSLLAIPWLVAGGRRARAAAAAVVVALCLLTAWRVELDPSQPASVRLDPAPSSRAEELVTAFDSLRSAPLFGVGPGRHPALQREMPFDAHCTPLNVAATYGLPALALFAAACLGALHGSASPAARATVLALLLDGLATDVEDFRHFWLALGLAARPRGAGAEPRPFAA